ncbi:hypothetical protein L195_g043994 [Trifolium pratense]|uniref:Uncharacterized protein n=1 Tax=Trifolium pratense TaxID=57577 RepID=A0A2K3MAT4_TRIPR|nr:hypothetical protein L195_g043994 [Trifolium pratense]
MRKLKYYLQLQEANRKKQEETERLAKLAEIHYKQRKREIEIAACGGLIHNSSGKFIEGFTAVCGITMLYALKGGSSNY